MPVFASVRLLLVVLLAVVALPACELVEGIFQAGLVVGILLILGAIALIAFLVGKVRRRV